MDTLIYSQATRRDFIKTAACGALSGVAQRFSHAAQNEPAPEGFTALFNGQTWANWQHDPHLDGVWEIADGTIRLRTDEPPRVRGKDYNLSTTRKFKDFSLMIDWRLTAPPM